MWWEKVLDETVLVDDTVTRLGQFSRTFMEVEGVVVRRHLPGGRGWYKYDVDPLDRKIICERLSRRQRIEKL